MRASDEFRESDLGDERLNKRLVKLAEQIAKAPDLSFPRAAGSDAAREATYRFLNNERVTPEEIVRAHVQATLCRCSESGPIFVIHDSSEFSFSAAREDLGRLSSDSTFGFLGHFALAVSGRGRAPLGVLGFDTLTREHGTRRPAHSERRPASERESSRWLALVDRVEASIDDRFDAIHVMDREPDAYEILAGMMERKRRFVIRSKFDRTVAEGSERTSLSEALERAPVALEREVHLSARVKRKGDPPSKAAKHPRRAARTARLLVSAAPIVLCRPSGGRASLPKTIALNVVRVHEASPPDGIAPVEWRLLTTEAIDSPDDIAAVVDTYRARWLIEEYFKALKTGCAFEDRQLESMRALRNALAVFVPIAWQLLTLRHLSRDDDATPAADLLAPLKLKLLRAHKDTRHMPCNTVRDAMLAIARLGGHIKNNGDPGWIVLGRGYEDLLLLEVGATLAIEGGM